MMAIDCHRHRHHGAQRQGKQTAGTMRGFRLANFWMIDFWIAGTLSMSFAAIAPVCADPLANALPTGGVVSVGSGTLNQNGNQLTVTQTTNKLSLNWQTFDIGKNAGVTFVQPNVQSIALNTVQSANPSQIYGRLNANGQIYLVNPNGIVVGPDATINAAAMILSTKTLADADFLAGRYNFNQQGPSSAAILNQGLLQVKQNGFVTLIGQHLTNVGSIQAPGGTAGLFAGDTVAVSLSNPAAPATVTTAVAGDARITNSGTIHAAGGTIQLIANNSGPRGANAGATMTQTVVIDQSGTLDTRTAGATPGAILIDGGVTGIVQQSGVITTANTEGVGGAITLLGDQVGLMSGSTLNASGSAGGGNILVGGNWQGQGPLSHASAVYMDPDATITSDATSRGNGGQVVLWSDDYTGFYGNISAQGGPQGGYGGQVETSSHNNLQAMGRVNVTAPLGTSGNWLLDPANVTIQTGGTGVLSSNIFSPASDSTIDPVTISSALTNGSTVTITASCAPCASNQAQVT